MRVIGFIQCSLLTLALATLLSCSDKSVELNKTKIVELTVANDRLATELNLVTEALQELQDAQQGFVTQQVVGQPVKYVGAGDTLQDVIDRKVLRCGGNSDLPGFGYLDPDSSEYEGFDIDFCRAIGAAVLGKQGSSQIQIVPVTSKLRFAALQSGEVDVLTRNTTWTLSRDTEMRSNYAAVTFYDGQGILVRTEDEIHKMSDFLDKAICVQAGSTSEINIIDHFETLDIPVEVRAFDDRVTALTQYNEGACDGYTGDKTSLNSQKTLLSKPTAHVIMLDTISREPLGPVVRHDDDNWLDVVSWTHQCMLNAELEGISRNNIEEKLTRESEAVKQALGIENQLGRKIGLADDYCYQVISQVGNYKDVYDRHLGPTSQFDLPRGLNALYTEGGLQYPLPMK